MGQEVGFRTSFRGFNKEDVLQCIERISEEKKTIARDVEEIRLQLEDLQGEKTLLEEKITAGNRLLAQLTEAVTSARNRAEQAENSSVALNEKLQRAEKTTRDYRSQLFAKEQEIIALQKDNEQLAQRLDNQQKMLEEAQRAAAEAGEASFQESVAAVRDDLVEVDAKIASLAESIRQTTESLNRVLEENRPTAAAQKTAQMGSAEWPRPAANTATVIKSKSKALSDFLLDKLADMLQ